MSQESFDGVFLAVGVSLEEVVAIQGIQALETARKECATRDMTSDCSDLLEEIVARQGI